MSNDLICMQPSIIFEALHLDAIERQLQGSFDEAFLNTCVITERFQSRGIVEVYSDRLNNMLIGEANSDEHFKQNIAGCPLTPVVYLRFLAQCYATVLVPHRGQNTYLTIWQASNHLFMAVVGICSLFLLNTVLKYSFNTYIVQKVAVLDHYSFHNM